VHTLRALWGSTHPGPTVVVTALAAALGVAAGLTPAAVVLLALAVFAGQVSIGISNDALDARRDRAVGRTDKPLARGDVTVRQAWVAAVTALVLGLALSVPLGWGVVAAHAILIGGGWAYNAVLKSTVFSLVPFVLSFGAFPSMATLAADPPSIAAPWATLAGAVLGAAVHLTNVLPDLDDDRATGVRGFPHRIGARASAVLAAVGIAGAATAVLLGPVGGDLGEVGMLAWAVFALVVALAVVTVVQAVRRPSRLVFRLVMLAALLLAVQLVLAPNA
jgi:4-hydroxybenzoate polyprenyltransferase